MNNGQDTILCNWCCSQYIYTVCDICNTYVCISCSITVNWELNLCNYCEIKRRKKYGIYNIYRYFKFDENMIKAFFCYTKYNQFILGPSIIENNNKKIRNKILYTLDKIQYFYKDINILISNYYI